MSERQGLTADPARFEREVPAPIRAVVGERDLSTPEEMGRVLRQDYEMWGEIVRRTGAKAE